MAVEDQACSDRVPKGASLTIGGDLPFEQLDDRQKRLIVLYRIFGCICDMDDVRKIELLKKELKEEMARRK